MDERTKRRIGEQVEPGDRPKAPGRLELLQRFINTWNHEFPVGWDRLGSSQRAARWLTAKGLVRRGSRITTSDVVRLCELREAIRGVVVANGRSRPPPEAVRILRETSASAQLTVDVDRSGSTSLGPVGEGVSAAAATLLGIMHEAQATGAWGRLKGCQRCGYAFYDRSKNRSGTWCAMSICGNRNKNLAYRRRRTAC